MSDGEQNPSPDRHLYAGFMRQFDEARRTVAALDTVFRDGNVEAVKDAQRIIRQLADRVQELEGKWEPRGSFMTREAAIEFLKRRHPGREPAENAIAATIDAHAALFGDLCPIPATDELSEKHRELYSATYLMLDSVCEDHPAIDEVFNIEAHGRVCAALANLDAHYEIDSPESLKHLASSPPSSVQPEKERRPIAEHELRGQIESYAPQSEDKEIGFRDGWRSSERFHGISPSPSMVGREGDGK